MVLLPINEYHSLFGFLFNVDLTKLRSLRVTFLSYTRENDEMFLDTRLLISRGKEERKKKIDIDFQFLIWIENWMDEWPTDPHRPQTQRKLHNFERFLKP